MEPHTSYPFFSFRKYILIEHLLCAGPQGTQLDERLVPIPKGSKPTSRRPPSEQLTGSLTPYLRPRHKAWEPRRLAELLEKAVGLEGEKAAAERNPIWEPGCTGTFYFAWLHRWLKNKLTCIECLSHAKHHCKYFLCILTPALHYLPACLFVFCFLSLSSITIT